MTREKGHECDALCRDVEEDRDRLAGEVERLRAEAARVRAAALLDFAKAMRDLAGQEDGAGPIGWPWTAYALAAVKAEEHAVAPRPLSLP